VKAKEAEAPDIVEEQNPLGPETAEDIQRRYDNGGMSHDEYVLAMEGLKPAPVSSRDARRDKSELDKLFAKK
jgi:hypothetical protein